jgi:hypothetical protein
VRLEWGSAKAAAAFRGRTPVRLKMLSMCSPIVDTEMNRILADVGVAVVLCGELEHFQLPSAQPRDPATPALGVEEDVAEVRPKNR